MPTSFDSTSFDIAASTGSYSVSVAPGSFDAMLSSYPQAVVIADAFFADRLAAAGIDPILIVAEEPAKELDRIADIMMALRDRGAGRGTMLIAVGGGVVQDIAAFAASIYMRGVDWTFVPTTMLAMTDSCIGGKSSINVGRYKNLVGTFHPPVAVQIDPHVTATLTVEARVAGLMEAAKISFCKGPACFDEYLTTGPSTAADAETLASIIALSLRAKSWFIEIDEFDRAERLLLNFGHTFGHAIESASRFAVSHGIAVGLGMLAALDLGSRLGRDYGGAPRVARLRAHVQDLLAQVDGLDSVLARLDPDVLMDAFRSDKKHSRSDYAVIVVTPRGDVERIILPRDAASEAMLHHGFAAVKDRARLGT